MDGYACNRDLYRCRNIIRKWSRPSPPENQDILGARVARDGRALCHQSRSSGLPACLPTILWLALRSQFGPHSYKSEVYTWKHNSYTYIHCTGQHKCGPQKAFLAIHTQVSAWLTIYLDLNRVTGMKQPLKQPLNSESDDKSHNDTPLLEELFEFYIWNRTEKLLQ